MVTNGLSLFDVQSTRSTSRLHLACRTGLCVFALSYGYGTISVGSKGETQGHNRVTTIYLSTDVMAGEGGNR